MSKATITNKDAKAFNLFYPIRKNPFQKQPIPLTKHTVLSKRKNTISISLMENSDISRVKTNNTKTVKLNYSRLMNTSMFKAKNTNSDIKNLSSSFRKLNKMENQSLTKLIDLRVILNKCTPIKLNFKLRLPLLINTWLILTIKITAYKKNLKASLRPMIK